MKFKDEKIETRKGREKKSRLWRKKKKALVTNLESLEETRQSYRAIIGADFLALLASHELFLYAPDVHLFSLSWLCLRFQGSQQAQDGTLQHSHFDGYLRRIIRVYPPGLSLNLSAKEVKRLTLASLVKRIEAAFFFAARSDL